MTETAPPRITVIVPAYNVAKHIGPAITSLKVQTLTGFEVLVIDDGSTDATRAEAEAAIGSDPRFRLIHQDNQGLSGARNTGLDQAQGRYIAFLDADDRYDPHFLKTLHDDLETSGADWVACGLAFCTPDGARHLHSAIHGQTRPDPNPAPTTQVFDLSDWSDVIVHFPSAWNKLYRRDFIGDLRFDLNTWYEDHTFFQRLAAKSQSLRHINRPLYLYALEREGQITRSDSDRVFDQIGVLETSAQILRAAPKRGAETALARLATRLFLERLDVIRHPPRATRFRAEAAAFLDRHGLAPDWQWDPYLPPLAACALLGQPPITLRLPESVAQGTAALDMLPDPGTPLASLFGLARDGLALNRVGVVIDLPALGRIDHLPLVKAAEAILASRAEAALLPLGTVQPPGQAVETLARPLTIEAALDLRPDRHGLMIRAAQDRPLAPSDPDLRLADSALRLAASGATVLHCPEGLGLDPDLRIEPVEQLLPALDAWQPALPADLVPAAKRRLFLRAARQDLPGQGVTPHSLAHRARMIPPLFRLWRIAQRRGWLGLPGKVDDDCPPLLRRILRVPTNG